MPRKIWLPQIAARSPKAIKYFQSQTKGIRTELDKAGRPVGCRVCTKNDPLPRQQTLYRMDKSDGTCFYLCGPHYVEVAKRIQKVETLREKIKRTKEHSAALGSTGSEPAAS